MRAVEELQGHTTAALAAARSALEFMPPKDEADYKAMFTDNVLRRIEGAGQTVGFWLNSGRWELIVVFGILSVAWQLLFWSEVVPSATDRPREY